MTMTFADLGVPSGLVDTLREGGVTEPFPIQAATIPDALAGRDVCGRAPTGSGKTLAFGLPLLARGSRAGPHRPRALVLAPTRELAEQIRRELLPLARSSGLRIAAVYGGVAYKRQRDELRRGADILVACPGRLADLIEQGAVRLDDVDLVVIDEADRMADMGFLPQVRKLLDMTQPRRQTLLFSATLDGDVAVLTRRYQRDPVRHELGGDATDAGGARHFFWRVEHAARVDRTADVIAASGPTIVFTRTRHGADRLARQLWRAGVQATAIHGGRSQGQRTRALRDFTDGRVHALIATDVAARGIHVDDVACVLHFDMAQDSKDYVHRSGRTARAGSSGTVVSFIQRDQVRAARRLLDELGLSDRMEAPLIEALTVGGGQRISDTTGARTGERKSQPHTGNGRVAGSTRSSGTSTRDSGTSRRRRRANGARRHTSSSVASRRSGRSNRRGR